MPHFLHKLWNDLIGVLLPRTCAVCGRVLSPMERVCCTTCTIEIPLTNYKAQPGNPIERIFWGKIPIVSANAFMHYQPHTAYARIITQLKYNNRPDYGIYIGQLMADDLIDTDFFKNIDCIIPIPLAKSRQKSRGYNQSEYIAKGIQKIVNIPIETSHVIRTKANKKQTQTHKLLRQENVKGIFALSQKCIQESQASPLDILFPSQVKNQKVKSHPLENKHILLIDDIFTTGQTLLSCSQVLAKIPGIQISILCAGVAGHQHSGPRLPKEEP